MIVLQQTGVQEIEHLNNLVFDSEDDGLDHSWRRVKERIVLQSREEPLHHWQVL